MAGRRVIAGVVFRSSELAVGGKLSDQWVTGKKFQLPAVNKATNSVMKKWALLNYKEEEYCKVGLLKHDLINMDDFWIGKEAFRRLTHDQKQDFYFRVARGLLQSQRKRNLPIEEWTPIDAEHCYLDDILAQIQKEQREQKLTKCALNDFDSNWERLGLIPFRMYHYFTIRNLRNSLAEKYSVPVM